MSFIVTNVYKFTNVYTLTIEIMLNQIKQYLIIYDYKAFFKSNRLTYKSRSS